MKAIFLPVVFVALSGVGSASAESTAEFLAHMKANGQYAEFGNSPEAVQMMLEGRKSEVNARLVAMIPKEATAADYFAVSNMLYRADAGRALDLMQRADRLSPNNPYIQYELAMHEHRAGNCQAALPRYIQVSKESPQLAASPYLWAYATHCNLKLGNVDEAIASWKKAGFGKHHTGIEKSMYEIFSFSNPDAERETLMKAVQTHSVDAACDLLELDKAWERDWWNIEENPEYVAYDSALIESLVSRFPQMNEAKSICINSATLDEAAYKVFATKSGYSTGSTELPASSSATYVLIRDLIKHKIVPPKDLLLRYGDALVAKHHADPKNKRILDVLAHLYSATASKDQLAQIDLHGWKFLGLQNYAESYVLGLAKNTAGYERTVTDAATQFPDSAIVQRVNLDQYESARRRAPHLVSWAASQFANVNRNWIGPDRLSNVMYTLEQEYRKE